MKLKTLLFKYLLLGIISFIGTTMSAQQTDTLGVFDPVLTDRHIVYSELMFYDVDEDGNFDASFNLATDTIRSWPDYCTALAFYNSGFQVRNGNDGGMVNTNTIVPIAGETVKVWTAIDVVGMTYRTYVQQGDMEYPEIVYDGDAAFRNTAITEISTWSAIHNPSGEPDSVAVQFIEVQPVSTDVTLRSVTSSLGTVDLYNEDLECYVTVPYGTEEITLTAIPNAIGASLTITDGDVTVYTDGVISIPSDGLDVYIEVVSYDGQSTASYYVAIDFDEGETNPNLSDLVLSTGRLTTEFDPMVTDYTVIVPNGTESVNIDAIPVWDAADVDGEGDVAITNGVGSATITVTSAVGGYTNTYNVTVLESTIVVGQDYYIQQDVSGRVIGENVTLQDSALNEPTQIFQLETSGVDEQYFIKNANGQYLSLSPSNHWTLLLVDDLTTNLDSCRFILEESEPGKARIVSAAKEDPTWKYIASDATGVGSGIYCDKSNQNERGVWVFRTLDEVFPPDAYLAALSMTEATIKPAFDATITEYYVTLPQGTTSINLDAVANDPNSNVDGIGSVSVPDASGTVIVTVTTSGDTYTKDYVIHYIKDTALTLTHSYTFADGTAKDVVGDAHGITNGGVFTNGVFANASDSSYLTFPAEEIAINTYPSITMEVFVNNVGINDGWSMLTYFGGLTGSNTFWTSIQNYDNNIKTVVNQGAGASQAVNPQEASSGVPVHFVTTLTNDSISLWLNGTHIETVAINEDYYIPQLSNENAWLCYGGYNDPVWLGEIEEFNIYSGVMGKSTIEDHFVNWPSDDAVDATLSAITIDGEPLEGFNPANLVYTVAVEEGAALPVVDATATSGVTPVVNQASEVPGVATIVVTNGGVTNTYTINFEIATGIGSDISKSIIKVYPTVSTGEFTVEMEGKSSIITVYDLAGRLVQQVNTKAQREVISLTEKGMYIVKVDSDKETKLFKVFKK